MKSEVKNKLVAFLVANFNPSKVDLKRLEQSIRVDEEFKFVTFNRIISRANFSTPLFLKINSYIFVPSKDMERVADLFLQKEYPQYYVISVNI